MGRIPRLADGKALQAITRPSARNGKLAGSVGLGPRADPVRLVALIYGYAAVGSRDCLGDLAMAICPRNFHLSPPFFALVGVRIAPWR
jgi:hypothetical protein